MTGGQIGDWADLPAKQAAWQALAEHHRDIAEVHLREMFAQDHERGARFRVADAGLHLDYSKHRITQQTMALLVQLAETCGLHQAIKAMFAGEPINVTERRPALHVALRMPRSRSIIVDGVDVVDQVHRVLDQMRHFADMVRSGQWRGFTGKPIRTVINIGIGGSDLGPVMAYHALRPYADANLDLRFVANVDPWDCSQALAGADPEQTLVIVSSKTFTTAETMANAQAARHWLIESLGDEAAVGRHFVAVSTNADAVRAFGIDTANMFGFWDWVGGRFSMDSAIGLSTMLAIGPKQFADLLAGFHAMDEHFRTTPFAMNMPVIIGLLTVWYRNFFGVSSVGVMPYDQRLSRFPAYLQQLTMESNGKRVTLAGEPVPHATAPVLWGEPGTNGQHSFFQLLHQGTEIVPIDFIAFARCATPIGDQHDQLLANALAQAQALAFGRTAEEVRANGTADWLVPHQVVPGNRPNSMILAAELTPYQLGTLVALYEHSVYTQSVIWGIDAFDQWGVELGKVLARSLVPAVQGGAPPATIDSSTQALLTCLRDLRAGRISAQ